MSIIYHVTEEPGLTKGQDGPGPWDQLVTQEPPPQAPPSPDSFGRPNDKAFPVNQRSPEHWSGLTYNVSGKRPSRLLSAQRGRKGFLVLIPSTAPAAVWVDSTDATLSSQGAQGFYLAIGAALSVETEGDLWAISATLGTDTQACVSVTWG